MRRALAVLMLAAGLMLAACGGDDDDNGDAGGNGAATVEETTPAQTTPAQDGAGGAVEITADPEGDLAYLEDRVRAQAGNVPIELTNESSVPHDVNVESEDGERLGGTEVITGDTARTEVQLDPGTYTFYCSVAGHREAGMEGTLSVE